MANRQNRQVLRTLSIIALTAVVTNDALATENRAMERTPAGTIRPVAENPSWFERMTTYHSELKPTYDPETQRVKMPNSRTIYTDKDGEYNTETTTVKPAWYDRATTYREEQRRPWNPYSKVNEKKVPAYMYYDKKEAKSWNEHYGQEGLRPVPYMYGSASLVLRKDRAVPEDMTNSQNIDGLKYNSKEDLQDARMVGMGNVYIRPANGFNGVDYRDGQNQLAMNRSNNIMLSDPVSAGSDVSVHNNVMIGNPKQGDVKAVTKIDKPKYDWREKLDTKPEMSRPGDFDYKKPSTANVNTYSNNGSMESNNLAQQYNQLQNSYGEGQVIAATGSNNGQFNMQATTDYNNGNVVKANNYTVETGDTLSEISDKEKIYGDWTLWPLIYDANRAQVQDPDLINPGQNLDIPRDYAAEQEQDARYRSTHREMPISLYDNR